MKPGWCWAACAKMVAHQYVKSIGGNEAMFANSLESDLIATGYASEDTGDIGDTGGTNDRINMIRYYTQDEDISLDTVGSRSNAQQSMSCDINTIIELIDNGRPVIFVGKKLKANGINFDFNITGHTYVAYGYYYNQNNELVFITYDPYTGSNHTGAVDELEYDELLSGTIADGYALRSIETIHYQTDSQH